MAESNPLELPVTPVARLAFSELRRQHGVTDAEIAAALVNWFAHRSPDEQREILDSDVAKERSAELGVFRPSQFGQPPR